LFFLTFADGVEKARITSGGDEEIEVIRR